MPQYVVKLEGGGEMRVNASSPQAARDNVASTGNTPEGSGGGGGGGGGQGVTNTTGSAGSLTARDGQTLSGQSAQTQADFRAIYGDNAEAAWVNEHNAALPAGTTSSSSSSSSSTSSSGQPQAKASEPTASAPAGNKPDDRLVNLQAAQLALQQAQQAAYQAYLNARLQLDNDTLAFQKAQQAFNESIKTAEMTGKFNGMDTQAAIKQASDIAIAQAGVTGMYNGAPTLQREQFQQDSAQKYLSLLASLRGPQDYGQYLRVLGSTPGGLRDLVGAAAGQFVPGTGATSGLQPQAVTLPGFINQATGYQPAATGAPGAQGGTNYAQYMEAAQNMPQPNQIAPQSWNAMTDTQKKLILGMYEQRGWNTQDVQDLYQQSLPKFGSAQPQTGQVRLV